MSDTDTYFLPQLTDAKNADRMKALPYKITAQTPAGTPDEGDIIPARTARSILNMLQGQFGMTDTSVYSFALTPTDPQALYYRG